MRSDRRGVSAGFTVFEVLMVITIVGLLASIAVPDFRRTVANQRLKDTALSLAGAINRARSEAIRTGNNHLVFVGTDATGADLLDANGDRVPVLVLDDGRSGTSNCLISSGESIQTLDPIAGISSGVIGSPGRAPSDLGGGNISTGSSLEEPGGTAASWLLFRPDGAPLAFDSACTVGNLGSGAGTFYIHNGDRIAAVSVAPTGGTRVHNYKGSWTP